MVDYRHRARAVQAGNRVLRVAPVTRAVRIALAATTLALAGSGAAFAGTCASTAPGTMECTGNFADTVTFPDADLTLVLGDAGVPTSVTPGPGDVGVDASWPGRVSVLSFADIATDSADGIHADGDGAVDVDNHGSITTYVGADGVQAVDILAGGNAGFTNSGDVLALGYGPYDITAVRVETEGCGCTVSVVNERDGRISALGQGDAIGIYGYSTNGDISIVNDGSIAAVSAQGLADGVFASGLQVDVANGGSISAYGVDWAAGIEAQGDDLVTVTNTGDIDAVATYGEAFGVYATGGAGGAMVDNQGSVYALALYATGLQAVAGGDVTVGNHGDITVGATNYTVYATGISAGSGADGAAITVDNTGTILASSYYGSRGIEAVATGVGGTVSVTNNGAIHASQDYKYGTSLGIVASADGDAGIDNLGLVQVDGGDNSYGIAALSFNGDASVTNGGDIEVTGGARATSTGIIAFSQNGGADVINDGSVAASGMYAYGVAASGGAGSAVANGASGAIEAYGLVAMGVNAQAGYGDVAVDNAGRIYANGLFNGLGIYGVSQAGDVAVGNSGGILAISSYYAAFGVFANADYGTASVDNGGTIVAASYYSDAVGITARAAIADVDNSGDIQVIADAAAYGIQVRGDETGTVRNEGSISAISYNGQAIGIAGFSDEGGIDLRNAGDVTVQGANSAIGMYAYGALGAIAMQNDGSIDATSTYGAAIGVAGVSYGGDVALGNAGSITATAPGQAIGLYGYSTTGDISITNDGDVLAYSADGLADGIFASGVDVTVANGGSITAYGYDWAAGIEAQGGDLTTVTNTGDIIASAYSGETVGIYATGGAGVEVDNQGTVYALSLYTTGIEATGGDVTVSNGGDIIVGNSAYTIYATGIAAGSGVDGAAITIGNDGTITADSYYGARGIVATATGVGSTAHVTNTGAIYASQDYKYGTSLGIVASADGDAGIDNLGLVQVGGGDNSYGVAALSFNGDASVTNGGDIDAAGGLMATSAGIIAFSQNGGAYVLNSGDVSAEGKYVYGVLASSSGAGDVVVANTGDGVIEAYSGLSLAMGIAGTAAYGDVSIDNAGVVYANGFTNGIGIYAMSQAGDVDVANSGDILGISYYYAAFGVFSNADYGTASVDNGGTIVAASYYSDAVGITARGSATEVVNSGAVQAIAYGGAYGAQLVGGSGVLDNSGTLQAVSVGGYGTATGAFVYGAGGAHVVNSGDIGGHAYGAGIAGPYAADSIGLHVVANGPVLVENSGTITATDDDAAIAVLIDSPLSTLENNGVLRTEAPIEGQLAVFGGDGIEQVLNYGRIDGALVLNGGDDILFNSSGGVWNVFNHSTDFGDGDDVVLNGATGTIALQGGAIHLGGSTDGNSFTNNGTVTVSGDNLIDMGMGNALPLANNGIISFLDGATDDILTVDGDLGGTGAILVDLDALNGSSDMLYVTGDVSGSQTVNVELGALPDAEMTALTPFAHVTGDSTLSSFVGGTINGYTPGNFLDLRVRIVGAIDAGNAVADVFSIGLEAAGLDGMGSLAASVASGAQTLLNSQVGTWRQRMGVLQGIGGHGPSPWLRYFDDRGDVQQEHVASNFGQGGSFGYDQSSSGWEAGVDARPGEHLHVGVMVGKSQADQRLHEAGAGSDRIDARSFGLYGTWTGERGFYLDASYRWTGFDARLRSGGLHYQTSAEAGTFNVEAGFTAWQLGGFDIQPQAQYTRTRIGDIETLHGPLVDFDAEGGVSERARLGVAFSKAVAGGNGWTWTPYGALSAVHEFDGEYAYALSNGFVGETRIDGTSALVEVGVGAGHDKLRLTGGLNWTDGGAFDSFVGGQLVVRYNW